MKTSNIRNEIDKIDWEIIKLLSKRTILSHSADKPTKKRVNGQVRKEAVNILDTIKRKAEKEGVDPHMAERIYRNILEYCSSGDRDGRGPDGYFPDI